MTNTTTLFVGGYTPNNDFFINGRYFIGFGQTVRANGAGSVLEANVQRAAAVAHTLQNIGCQVILNSSGVNSTNWVSRIGAADGNQLAVLTSSVTGYIQDTTHTDSISVGNLTNCAFHGVSGGPDTEITSHNVVVLNTSPLQEMAWGCQASIDANSLSLSGASDAFLPIMGGSGTSANTSEATSTANTQLTVRAAGVFKGLQATLTTNTTGSAITFQKNGGNGNQTIAPGTTAAAANTQDTTHTDSVVSGDTVNVKYNAGSHTMNTIFHGLSFLGTTSAQDLMTTAGSTFTSASSFMAVGGSWGSNTVESQSQIKWHIGGTWDRLRVRLQSNSLSTNQTVISRNATANGNQVVTMIAGSGAATLEDTTHTDSVSGDALVNYANVASGSPTGSAIWAHIDSRFNDNSNSGSSTETAAVTLAIGKPNFNIAASDTSFANKSVNLAIAKMAFAVGETRKETSTASLAIANPKFNVHEAKSETAAVTLAIGAPALAVQVQDLSALNKLRQFNTFG